MNDKNTPLSLDDYLEIVSEINEQPEWRHNADRAMDYADGNQLDCDLLRKQQELGIPPAVEDLIGPALLSIQGYEATIRADWRVTPNGDIGGQDVADALNYKLNTAERESHADRACSDAFRPQIGCGIGWVEVTRESDPFKFPYRCTAVHRNEIHWDMKAVEDDLSDARWLRRTRWLSPERIEQVFPQHKGAIRSMGNGDPAGWGMDGGSSTGLQNNEGRGRAWTILENHWFNSYSRELCLAEVWYRRWDVVPVLKMPDGRVVEYDADNVTHNAAVIGGLVKVQHATVTRVRRAYWIGDYCLYDGPSPYPHRHFPYVPFFGFREDMTGVPYGYVRGMKFAQDNLNSGIAKLRWGMAVVRVERTAGVTDLSDTQLRQEVARRDSDIKLNPEAIRSGGFFKVMRDYQLTEQHFQLLESVYANIDKAVC
jgi:hypothetical protein